MCFCSLFYFSLLLIFTLVAASISHFLSAAIKFLCFSPNKIRLHCVFIPHSSTLLVIHAIVAIKFKSKKDWALLCCFLFLKVRAAIYLQNALGA